MPVANPDGYDWTFEPASGCGARTCATTTATAQIAAGRRRRPQPQPRRTSGATTTRAPRPTAAARPTAVPAPNSEPETQALDAFVKRVGFEFFVNYHSAAELLLYGTGWQVSTPTPDDVIAEAMAGDDAHPAVPGYDPDISAELYTTNGDTDTHMTENYGTFGFTPEMSTCEAASDSVPDDEWEAEDCGSGFEFPDDEALDQAEFRKNIPFALSVAESAEDPDDPVSVVGRRAEDFRVDSFDVSYGDPQTVAVVAKRALKHVALNYRINNGRTRTASVSEWRGGERYGDENDRYYAEFRGEVRGTRAGDRVKVWFTGEKRGRHRADDEVASASFTYTVEQRHRREGARARQRGLQRRQPDLPGRDERAEVRRGAPGRGPRGRLQRRRVGRRRAGRAARPRRARPLRRDRLVPRRQPAHAGSRRTS